MAPHDERGHGAPAPAPEPLPVAVVDNHTHLDIRRDDLASPLRSDEGVAAALAVAAEVGVDRVVQVGCDLKSARWTVEILDDHPAMLGAVALHPNEAPRLADEGRLAEALAEIETLAAHPRVRAVGETGLDYYRTGEGGVAAQQESFRWHIDLAKRTGKALQIHDRDAHDDVVQVLLDAPELPEHVVFHCFSGGPELAQTCNEHGWTMSFAGPVTFAANHELRAALEAARPELILVETDAPFLTPHPHRGRPNAPYLVPLTLRHMAEVRGVDVAELAHTVMENTTRVYGAF